MSTFEHFNSAGDSVCPVCGTKDDKEIVLIPIDGTEDGNNMQAIQVHTDCLSNLSYAKEMKVIYVFTKY